MNPARNTLTHVLIVFFLLCTFSGFAQQNNPLINSGGLLKKGQALHDEGKYKEAIEAYKQINRSDTNYSDALYELSMSCYSDSQMQSALDYAKEGLRLFPRHFTRFTMEAANALGDLGKNEEALAAYDSALVKDPQSFHVYFAKGVTLYLLKREEEAKIVFQQSMMINPFNASPHYFLGNIYLHQGKLVPALLAYQTYLLLAPDGKYLNTIISNMGKVAAVSDDILAYVKNKKSGGEDNFDFVQQILQSKVALDSKYLLKAALEDNIVRQLQVVNEKLEYRRNDKGFAMQFYVPLYIQTFSEGNFEPMIFSIFSGLDIAQVAAWNKKHKKEADAFSDNVSTYLDEIRSSRTLMQPDRKTAKTMYLFENGNYVGQGSYGNNRDKFTITGIWEFYHDNGQVRSKGNFNEAEKKEGDWIYYYDDGTVKEKISFKNDEQEGMAEGWFTNGNKWYTEYYKNGKLDGKQILYYYNGKIKQINNYIDDKLNGPRKGFTSEGALESETSFIDDQQDGLTVFYYPSGAKQDESMYKNNLVQGKYKAYYESGKLKTDGEFKDDKRQGLWIIYYENGNLKEKTTYVEDEITGEFSEYHDNGKLSRKGNYTRKKLDGKLEDFDDDGKLFSDAIYEKGKLKEINFYDKTGKQVYNTGTRKGAANISFYSPDGIKTGEGFFNRDGNKEGKFTDYYLSGKISEETYFKDGIQDGMSTSYYFNGQKKSENNYSAGKENGYTKGYYFNGKLNYEGWVVDDQKQQQIIYYNQQGDITAKENYLNDELDGYTEYYNPGNIHDFDYRYHNGWLEQIIQFDSTGKILCNNVFQKGSGKVLFKHYNGKTKVDGTYKDYMLEGVYTIYNFDGTVRSVSYFKNDKRDSVYKEYYYGGSIKIEGRYKNGIKDGLWKFYHENGKVSDEENFTNGASNGINKIYNTDGSLDKTIAYKNGNLNGEFRIYGDNNQLAIAFNYKDGFLKSYTYEDKSGALVSPILLAGSNGKIKSLYRNGTISADMNITDNDQQGPLKIYYSSGKTYIEGKREYGYYDGLRKVFYPDGSIWSEDNYVLGNLHGIKKSYYPNGKLEKEEFYYNDELHGTCKYYDDKGKLKQTRVYYYDNLISVN